MDLELRDKVVFVTGASGGIGRALAEEFAAEGAKLALTGNDAFAALDQWVKGTEVRDALALKCDTTVPEQVDAAMEAARARFGRVDVCIANAGRWTSEFALAHQATPDRIRKNIEINLLGSFWTARAFMSALSKSGARTDGAERACCSSARPPAASARRGTRSIRWKSRAVRVGALTQERDRRARPVRARQHGRAGLDRDAHGAARAAATGSDLESRAHDAAATARARQGHRARGALPFVARALATRQRRSPHRRRWNGRPLVVGVRAGR
jgi:NAD(P)-dependent dehydrogenase (short-subunit alcohol dehydrogenase family)